MKRNTAEHRSRSIAGFVLVLGLALSPTAGASGGADDARLDVQGHRGWRGRYPENTMAAFRAAVELGVTTLELDVQITRDGVPVVHHDPRLNGSHCVRDDGTPVGSSRLSQVDLEDLAGIDCGSRANSKFPEQQAVPGERIPTLDQVLELADDVDYPVRFSIEIKMQDTKSGRTAEELAAPVVEAILARGLEQRTVVQSFDAEALVAVAEQAPELGRAILVRSPGSYERAVERSRATILSPRHDGLTEAAVGRFQKRGVAVIPWTVNKSKSIERMIDWGVDGIISDYPDRVLEVLGRASADEP